MKQTKKKKKRSRNSKLIVRKNNERDVDDEEREVLRSLMEAFSSVSMEEAASAYREANGDPNKAAEIVRRLAENLEFRSTTCSVSNDSMVWSSSSGCNHGEMRENVPDRIKPKPKRLTASTGMVSTILGKDYMASGSRREHPRKETWDSPSSKDDIEQFLCSMLGDECELSMAVVRDVLSQTGYDLEKALNVLLDLSATSKDQSAWCGRLDGNIKEDSGFLRESSSILTDRASDTTSLSSENEIHDNFWSMAYKGRNFSEVLTGLGANSSFNLRNSSIELPQEVLESLFKVPKSSQHEPKPINWRNMIEKMETIGQKVVFNTPENAEKQHHTPGHPPDVDYHMFRESAKQHWESMKSFYQKAAAAYTSGERGYAAYLSEQGRVCSKMAQRADEKASRDIFESRNKSIENVITIDLHGQHVKQAIRLLKLHLLFGAYVRSVRLFRVITGCGAHGVGKSKLKQLVVSLLEKEGIEWKEENRGTLMIRLDGQMEFSFLDSESDTE